MEGPKKRGLHREEVSGSGLGHGRRLTLARHQMAHKPAAKGFSGGTTMGFHLEAVVERLQGYLSEAPLQRRPDEVVSQVRVFRQNRAVQIGPDGIFVDTPFPPVFGVVATTREHL